MASSRSAALGLPVSALATRRAASLAALLATCVQLRRCLVEALDQAQELGLDAADAGDLRLGAAKLLSHLGKLPLKMLQILELRGLAERGLEPRRDLVHARVEARDLRRTAWPR